VPVAYDVKGLSRQTGHNGTIEHKGVLPGLSNGQGPPLYEEKGRTGENLGRPQQSQDAGLIAQLKNPGNSIFGDWRVYYDNARGNLDEAVKAVYHALGEGLIGANETAAALAAVLKTQAVERGWPVPKGTRATDAKLNEAASASRRTAASTIEALLYELRSGLSCLADQSARDRLGRCDRAAMRAIAKELLRWKSKNEPWLPAWSTEDVAKLLRIRRGLK
jgi:hypothetical protein